MAIKRDFRMCFRLLKCGAWHRNLQIEHFQTGETMKRILLLGFLWRFPTRARRFRAGLRRGETGWHGRRFVAIPTMPKHLPHPGGMRRFGRFALRALHAVCRVERMAQVNYPGSPDRYWSFRPFPTRAGRVVIQGGGHRVSMAARSENG